MVALSAGVLRRRTCRYGWRRRSAWRRCDARIVLALEVTAPARQLEERDGRLRDTLKYEVLIVDEKKAKVRSVRGLEGRITLSPNAAAGPAPDAASYQVTETIDVQPGRYEFRVSATSAKLGKGGSVYLGVDVPDFRSAPLVLGGLSIVYAEGARVAVASRRPAGCPSSAARVVTRAPGSVRFTLPPTLDRYCSAADTLRVYAELTSRAARLRQRLSTHRRGRQIVLFGSPLLRVRRFDHIQRCPSRRPGACASLLRVTLSARDPRDPQSGFAIR